MNERQAAYAEWKKRVQRAEEKRVAAYLAADYEEEAAKARALTWLTTKLSVIKEKEGQK